MPDSESEAETGRSRPGGRPPGEQLTVLAFDFGLRWIGVAVGQTITRTASPIATVLANRGAPRWEEIDGLVREWQPGLFLVGLPLNMDSTPSEMAGRARDFAESLAARYGIGIRMVDERLTSFEARGLSSDDDERHRVAARLIAESWLSGGS